MQATPRSLDARTIRTLRTEARHGIHSRGSRPVWRRAARHAGDGSLPAKAGQAGSGEASEGQDRHRPAARVHARADRREPDHRRPAAHEADPQELLAASQEDERQGRRQGAPPRGFVHGSHRRHGEGRERAACSVGERQGCRRRRRPSTHSEFNASDRVRVSRKEE